jgi:hypothetical protein
MVIFSFLQCHGLQKKQLSGVMAMLSAQAIVISIYEAKQDIPAPQWLTGPLKRVEEELAPMAPGIVQLNIHKL